jgi:hypothetical protein
MRVAPPPPLRIKGGLEHKIQKQLVRSPDFKGDPFGRAVRGRATLQTKRGKTFSRAVNSWLFAKAS